MCHGERVAYRALTQQARTRGLTLNTYVQAAWGLLLGRLTGRDDVVFGVTVAGRPPEIAGIESMVGLFINTLPLRVRLPAGQPLVDLLTELQESQSRLIAHQHLGLAEIQGLAGLGELFDTLVVFENYPVDRAELAAAANGLAHHRASQGAMRPIIPELGGRCRASDCSCGSNIVPICLIGTDVRALLGSGWYGCWRRQLRRRSGRSGGSTFSARESATRSCGVERHRAGDVRVRRCRSCSPRRRRARPDAIAVVFGEQRLTLRASSTRAPTSWRITCAASGSVPRWWSGCASSARSRWWSGCSASSRRAAPICRSILPTRASASPSCSRMRRRRCWSRKRRCVDRLPSPWRAHRAARCRLARHCAQPRHGPAIGARIRTTPPTSSTPPARPAPPKAVPWRTERWQSHLRGVTDAIPVGIRCDGRAVHSRSALTCRPGDSCGRLLGGRTLFCARAMTQRDLRQL